MEKVVRSAIGGLLQTAHLTGVPYEVLPNTTLNQKFSIHQTEILAPDQYPKLRYLGVGNGGHRFVTGPNGIAKPDVYQHKPTDTALYNQLPFILRRPDEDLTPSERQMYRLRRHEVHHGVTYVAYYLRMLDYSNTVPTLELRTVVNGETTTAPYTPTLADLNPTPQPINPNIPETTTGEYVAATAKLNFVMTADDVQEFLNVANIIYNDEGAAQISEIALCTGVDRPVMGDFNGNQVSYTESIATQVFNYVGTYQAMKYNNTGLDVALDIGSVEPLLVMTP